MTDAGPYQCTATSPAGTCVTKCRVTVIRTYSSSLIFFSNFCCLLLALSEAGQYPKDLPQYAPQQLAKLPLYVVQINETILYLIIMII